MKISFLTIFPGIFSSFLETSLIGKAQKAGKLLFSVRNIRDFAEPPHQQVDDIPYGGGAGMVMKPEPLAKAIKAEKELLPGAPVILMSASGRPFRQSDAVAFSREQSLIIIAARYEGIDQRIIDKYVDHELTIGDFVLMGGEVPAMAVVEAITRLVPGVIGNSESLDEESFSMRDDKGLLIEGPQYTRPPEFEGSLVPDILLSGDHSKIRQWRKDQAKRKRALNRPDLLSN